MESCPHLNWTNEFSVYILPSLKVKSFVEPVPPFILTLIFENQLCMSNKIFKVDTDQAQINSV